MNILSNLNLPSSVSKELQTLLQDLIAQPTALKNSVQAQSQSIEPRGQTIQVLLNSLLKELQQNTKSSDFVNTLLKEPKLAKPMQQIRTELNTLLQTLKADPALQKHAQVLGRMLVHVRSLDAPKLHSQLQKSGVAMESKLAKPMQLVMPQNLQEAILSLKPSLSAPTFDKISTISIILNKLSNSKQIESKSLNQVRELLVHLKPLLVSLKKSDTTDKGMQIVLQKSVAQVKKLDTLLTQIFSKQSDPLKQNIQNNLNIYKESAKSGSFSESTQASSNKNDSYPLPKNIQSEIKSAVLILKDQLSPQLAKLQHSTPLATVQRLQNAISADKNFTQDVKTLVLQIKALAKEDGLQPRLVQITAKLEQISQKALVIETAIKNDAPPQPFKVLNQLRSQTTEILKELSTVASDTKVNQATFGIKETQILKEVVDSVVKMPEFFPRQGALPNATLSELLARVVKLLKSELNNQLASQSSENSAQENIPDQRVQSHLQANKAVMHLDETLRNAVATKTLRAEQPLQQPTDVKQLIADDLKATLGKMRSEISTLTHMGAKDALMQIDRALAQVEYYQILSLSSNGYASFLPLLWEGLEEGQLNIKKLKENRFFCEINLTLKEYGQVDLMLMLFEDVHVNISVFAQKSEFLDIVRQNSPQLKRGLSSLGLVPSSLQLFDGIKDQQQKNKLRTVAEEMQVSSGFSLRV